ncbi:helix-turn-helix domain-containing protein [Plastoroseomonas hellenica]|uniref:helix-turn-helix domain-containing protein n=1 Tax=Plastoroseomonas hellenica TaxID=2687306 RepID=UPI001BA93D2E|nr:helix-turn-helix domain-containing protein [Plastoroseomonas hellenica]MBR0644014.1 hypothetical protein [Plastoroseomonas hellenica]
MSRTGTNALQRRVDQLTQRVEELQADMAELRRRGTTAPPLSLREMTAIVADVFEVPVSEIMSDRRHQPIALARQVAMEMAALRLGFSLPRIGRFFKRDHTTVLSARRRIAVLRRENPAFAARLDVLAVELEHAQSPQAERIIS